MTEISKRSLAHQRLKARIGMPAEIIMSPTDEFMGIASKAFTDMLIYGSGSMVVQEDSFQFTPRKSFADSLQRSSLNG